MVKKCLIAIAVVALLVTTVQAGDDYPVIKTDDEVGNWPWTKIYDEVAICDIPVKLEVGHYVQLYKCNKLKIELVQVDCDTLQDNDSGDFPCYKDCVEIKARANFPATFGVDWHKSGPDIIEKHREYWKDDKDTIQGSTGDYEKLTVCMEAWKVELWNAGEGSPGEWVTVGKLTLTVKPQNETGGSWDPPPTPVNP